ncbi:MAG: DUF2183 domain-containing protein [Bdellovibrio sp.]|nr:DUF2183 domain-containing protein [Bdellovibrio sp.]
MGRMWASLIMIVGISLASTLVFAGTNKKVLLITDIDDTIKVSHVLSTTGKVSRAADITTPFTGMSQLLQWIIIMNPLSTKMVYLSNAPEEIAGVPAIKFSHQSFLEYNSFPKGDLLLREDWANENHKIETIRNLIDSEMPEIVILIGDNGERDAEIYHQAVVEYGNLGIQIIPFIHQLYATEIPFYIPDVLAEVGKPIFAEQFGFVTPIEIAVELNKQNVLSAAGLQWMIQEVAPYIVDESSIKWDGLKPITFPFFANCSDFKWRWAETAELMPLINKIKKQCN